MKQKHLILIGLMGAGKSSIGTRLADLLNREFMDTDALVEEKAGRRIFDIFQEEGEECFRKRETEAVQEAVARSPGVIATGGGSVLTACNRDLLWSQGKVYYLKASIRCLVARVAKSKDRPLLQESDPAMKLEGLLRQRSVFYEQAHRTVEVDDRPVKEIATEIQRDFLKQSS